jgi:hypothetical protein
MNEERCPNCGYCPVCKQSRARCEFVPYYPNYPVPYYPTWTWTSPNFIVNTSTPLECNGTSPVTNS